MPIVGSGKNKKEFPYTKKGKAKAKKFAKKTGKKVTMSNHAKTSLQAMFDVEQKEAKSGMVDKETKKDVLSEMKSKKKKSK